MSETFPKKSLAQASSSIGKPTTINKLSNSPKALTAAASNSSSSRARPPAVRLKEPRPSVSRKKEVSHASLPEVGESAAMKFSKINTASPVAGTSYTKTYYPDSSKASYSTTLVNKKRNLFPRTDMLAAIMPPKTATVTKPPGKTSSAKSALTNETCHQKRLPFSKITTHVNQSCATASHYPAHGKLEDLVEDEVLDIAEVSVWEKYECTCCFNEVPFEYLVQCMDGHLLCIQCLQRYVQESVYGQGRGSLKCLHEGCDAEFPESQLLRALPESLKQKYEERILEEMLLNAHLNNLIRCPFCHVGAELDSVIKYFRCPNLKCLKVTCRDCQVLFKDHKGLSCSQVEKKQETDIRKEFEEKMTTAKIRQCYKCMTKYTKEDGCNKITCRCGAIMCYICRTQINDYKHFCQHVRSPGKKCSSCTQCSLWTNPEQDEDIAVKEIKQDAANTRRQMGFKEIKEIGAPNN